MKSTLVKTITVAGLVLAAQLDALSVFHVGNSLTDQCYGMHDIAQGFGYTWKSGRHMIPGAPLEWLWTHRAEGARELNRFEGSSLSADEVLKQNSYDAVTLQPFDRGVDSDVEFGGYYAQAAWQGNPNAQVYIFAHYPLNTQNYESNWNAASSNFRSRAFFDSVASGISKNNPTRKKVLVIPLGEVIYQIQLRMNQNGSFPGLTGNSVSVLYDDDVHLNDLGKYLEAATFFSTIYKQSPVGAIRSGLYVWSGPYSVSQEFADAVQPIIWQVVSTYPSSGVGSGAPAIQGSSTLPSGAVGSTYRASLVGTGSGTLTWRVVSGTLPTGIQLGSTTGVLSGTPTVAGTTTFTIGLDDTQASTPEATKQFTVQITPPQPPQIEATGFQNAVIGKSYRLVLAVNGGSGTLQWSILSGTMPPGLQFYLDSGVIQGIPTQQGNYLLSLRVRDSQGQSDTLTGTLAVTDGRSPGLSWEVYYQNLSNSSDVQLYSREGVGVIGHVAIPNGLQRMDQFGLQLKGWLNIPANGAYTFELQNDAGAKLYLNRTLLIDNDGVNASGAKTGTVTLAKGYYPLKITYYESTGSEQLALKWSGPGISSAVVPDSSFFLENPEGDNNLILNGAFASGLQNWNLLTFAPGAAQGSIATNQEYFANITNAGSEIWSVQLVQGPITLKAGKTYQLTYQARSSESRDIVLAVGMSEAPWTKYLQETIVTLTTGPKYYQHSFTMPVDLSTARLEFNLGNSTASNVWIDDVALVEMNPDVPVSIRAQSSPKLLRSGMTPVQFRLNVQGFHQCHELLYTSGMASSSAFVDRVLKSVSGAGSITAKKMFGEYGVYCEEKIVALICDDQFFVKRTEEGYSFWGEHEEAPPYKGAKPLLVLSEEDLRKKARLVKLIQLTYQHLPAQKKHR
jgi:TfoX/Sxy family transcriptional regulator of competence genes